MDAQDHGTVPGLAAPEQPHDHHLARLGPDAAPAVLKRPHGLSEGHKEKAPDARAAGAETANERADKPNHTEGRTKPWATLRAEFTLVGWTAWLIDGDDGRAMLVVSRWALTRQFAEVDEARAFLSRVAGGRR